MKRRIAILAKLNTAISKDACILDFGCGAGQTVYSLLDQGYINTFGFDVKDYLELRDPKDRSHFLINDSSGKLPFKDNSFDLIISEQVLEHVMDQVGVLRELHRIMRPGAIAMHVFAARYRLIEPHFYVPMGSILGHRWWYKLWACLGIRSQFQNGLSADETADRNAFYFVEGLNYVSSSLYEVVLTRLGYQWKWFDQEELDTSERAIVRVAGKLNRVLPLIGWMFRTFHTQWLYLKK